MEVDLVPWRLNMSFVKFSDFQTRTMYVRSYFISTINKFIKINYWIHEIYMYIDNIVKRQ